MAGDDLPAATDHHPLDVTAHPDVAMAIGHRHRVVVGLVTDQRLRADLPGAWAQASKGAAGGAAMASRSRVRRSPMVLTVPAQDIALAAAALLLKPPIERFPAGKRGSGTMKLRREKPTRPSTAPLSFPLPGRPYRSRTR